MSRNCVTLWRNLKPILDSLVLSMRTTKFLILQFFTPGLLLFCFDICVKKFVLAVEKEDEGFDESDDSFSQAIQLLNAEQQSQSSSNSSSSR